MDIKTQVGKAMTEIRSIPPGQMFLYKALLEAGPRGLTLDELAAVSDRPAKIVSSTLGALGNRVTQTLGELEDFPGKPSELLIPKRAGEKNEIRYHLTPALHEFIESTPDLEAALRESDMSKFHRYTPEAWRFAWNETKTGGDLEIHRSS